jgi:hypothetical protein
MILNLGKIFGCQHLEFAMVLDMREDGYLSYYSLSPCLGTIALAWQSIIVDCLLISAFFYISRCFLVSAF